MSRLFFSWCLGGLSLVVGSAVAFVLTMLAWMLWSTPEVKQLSLWTSLVYTVLYVFVRCQSRRSSKFVNVLVFGVLVLAVLQPPTTAACRCFKPKL
eukprot:4322072-Amphidinium_carterae.1